MADPAAPMKRPVGREDAEAMAAAVPAEEPMSLAALWVDFPEEPTEPHITRFGVCYLVMVREGGFMLVAPDMDPFRQVLESLETNLGPAGGAFHSGLVGWVTTRKRDLGMAEALLVDLPWEAIELFYHPLSLRGAALRQHSIIHFKSGQTVGRPTAGSVLELANGWIGGDLDAATAEEYATGVEQPDLDDAEPGPLVEDHGAVVAQLRRQIQNLEATLASQGTRNPPPPAGRGSVGSGATLFAGQSGTMTAADWTQLQTLAGTAPGRSKPELSRSPAPPRDSAADSALAEIEKGAAEDASLGLGAMDLTSVQDPMQRLLLVQMQQNSLLMQRFMQPRDSMASLLTGGSGSDSGSTSTGARGCMAREMFLKAIQDHGRIAEQTRDNALRELGIPLEREDGYLMRRYLERRVPLQDQKLLAHVGTLVSEGWAIAHQSNNLEMKGFLSRMLLFVEQTALDSGKMELAWLLTGFTEPNSHLFFPVKKTPGLKPFSRLANPLWLSANLAYLRDLDYLQTRTASLGKGAQKVAGDGEPVQPKNPKPKNQGKPGKKQKGEKGEKAEAVAET